MKSKTLKNVVLCLAILLVFALGFGVTGAFYRGQFLVKSNVTFNEGIFISLDNATQNGSEFYFNTVRGVPLDDKFEVREGDTISLLAPQLNISEKTTTSFYLRAYIETHFYKGTEEVELEDGINKLFSQFLVFDPAHWGKHTSADGIDYYYLVNDTGAKVNEENLRELNKNSGQISFFTTESLTIRLNSNFDSLNGGPEGITSFKFSLKVEVVEVGHIDEVGWECPITMTFKGEGIDYTKDSNNVYTPNKEAFLAEDSNNSRFLFKVKLDPETHTAQIGSGSSSTVLDKTVTNIVIPDYIYLEDKNETYLVTSIGNYAFSGCTSLSYVSIPEGVTRIGASAFSGCTSLSDVSIPEGVTSIENDAFHNCRSLTSITIPSSVTIIAPYAFSGCSRLTSVTIPSSVTSILDYAFQGCSSLASITISSGVTSIGYQAFFGCSSLTSISIPSSVTSVGGGAFSCCSNLKEVIIERSQTPLTALGDDAFLITHADLKIYVPEGTGDVYRSASGWITYADRIVENPGNLSTSAVASGEVVSPVAVISIKKVGA